MSKQKAIPGYRYMVRLKDSHRIMYYWRYLADAQECVEDWNFAHFDGRGQVYLEDTEKSTA